MSILILGALPKTEQDFLLYQSISDTAQDFATRVKSPIDTVNFKGSNQEKYNRAFRLVKESDLIIGEQSNPSTGQGMEIREAAILNKPLIVVAKSGSKISGLVKSCPITKEIFYYDNIDDLKSKLKKSLQKIKK